MTILLASMTLMAYSQASVQWDYVTESELLDHDDEECGKGGMQRIKTGVTLPLKMSDNRWGSRDMWGVASSFTHAWMENKGIAQDVNPGKIINCTVSLLHMRALGERWGVIGAVGVGIYAPDDYLRWKSLLANAGMIFTYKLNSNFTWGFGGGLTNSYGVPMILPMAYINWTRKGAVKLTVNLSNGVKVAGSVNLSRHVRLDVNAIEFDAISAVIDHEGRERLYSMQMVRSTANFNVKLNKDFMMFVGGGYVFLRRMYLKNRRISNILSTSDENKYSYRPSAMFSVGVVYKPQF